MPIHALATAANPSQPPSHRDAILTLPFVRETPAGGLDYWSPVETGDSGEDGLTGRAYAKMVVLFMARHRSPLLLGRVSAAMIQKGRAGDVETGFFAQLAELVS